MNHNSIPMTDPNIKDKNILITCVNHGIDAAVAKKLAEQARWITGQLIYAGPGHRAHQ